MSVRMLPNYSFNLFFFSFQMILSISSHYCVGVFLLAQSPPPPPELSVICSNQQNMGLCKELLKTELEGEKGGGCCDRLLQNSGYNIKCYWLETL